MINSKSDQLAQKLLELELDTIQNYVKMGEIVITKSPERYNLLGIGTCLGVFIYDLKRENYALAHTLLPKIKHDRPNRMNKDPNKTPARFTDEGIRIMIKRLERQGSNKQDLKVKLVGGSKIFNDSFEVGKRNLEAARQVIMELGIDLVKEEVGGNTGRSISVFNRDGSLDIRHSGKTFKI